MINAGLAAGAALAALPVILHLFMRQTPKHVIFPALRLVRERQKRSRKRMRIKNWLLLLARMAVLALMALALARPRLYSQMPLGDESVPTALGLVFDTSLSMSYKENGKTRLDEAKERARAILDKIPDSSLVFVVDSSQPGVPVGLSPAAARKRVDDLAIHPVNRPLNAAMGQVYPAVAECDRPRHEVYVLTDLARTSWNPEQRAEGLDRVEKAKTTPGGKIATFILRLGAAEVEDVAIDTAEPASNIATQGEALEIRGRVHAQGPKPASRVVEFYLDGVKKGQKAVELPPGGQAEVSFLTPPRLSEGEVHRGELKLSGTPDPLEFNDSRYFTFKVRPPLKVLLISDLAIDAEFVAAALDPDPTPSATSGFQVARVRPAEFVAKYRDSLRDHAAVFLLNVEALDEDSWSLLNGYVHEGGGLVIGLGDRCNAENYNGPIAGQVLPAQLDQVKTAKGETSFGKVADVTHPLFQRYAKEIDPQLSAGAGLPLLGCQAADGDARPDELHRSSARAARADLQGLQDRPGLCSGPLPLAPAPNRKRSSRVERVPLAGGQQLVVPGNHEPDGSLPGRNLERAAQFRGRRERPALARPGRPVPELPRHRTRHEDHRVTRSIGRQRRPRDPRAPDARPVDRHGQGRREQANPARLQPEPAADRKPVQPPEAQRPRRDLRQGRLCPGGGCNRPAVARREGPRRYRALSLADDVDHDHRDAGESSGQHVLQGNGPAGPGQRRGVTTRALSFPSSLSYAMFQGFSVSLNPIGPWPVLVAAAFVVLVLTLWAYARKLRSSSGGWRWVALGLRLLALLLCLLAALRPSVILQEKKRQAATLVFLLDSSTSMTLSDEVRGQTRWAVARKAMEQALEIAKSLGPNLEVKSYRFDAKLNEAKLEDRPPPSPKAARPTWARAILDAEKREAQNNKRIARMVIFSDFASNNGINPLVAARRLRDQQVPVVTVGLGSETAGAGSRDISVQDIATAPTVFVKNVLEVRGNLKARGFSGQPIEVEMFVEGQSAPVAKTQVKVPEGADAAPITGLKYIPQTPGEKKITLRVTPLDGEFVTTNNEISTFVTVLSGGLNVMFLQGPNFTWDYRYLMRSIMTSPDIQVEGVVIRRPARGEASEVDDAEFAPGRYNIYVLSDLPAEYLAPRQHKLLAEAVKKGAGLMMLGGRTSFGAGGWAQTDLADILPAEIHPGDGQLEPEGGVKFVPEQHGADQLHPPDRREQGRDRQALGHDAAGPRAPTASASPRRERRSWPRRAGPAPSRCSCRWRWGRGESSLMAAIPGSGPGPPRRAGSPIASSGGR